MTFPENETVTDQVKEDLEQFDTETANVAEQKPDEMPVENLAGLHFKDQARSVSAPSPLVPLPANHSSSTEEHSRNAAVVSIPGFSNPPVANAVYVPPNETGEEIVVNALDPSVPKTERGNHAVTSGGSKKKIIYGILTAVVRVITFALPSPALPWGGQDRGGRV